MAGGWGIWMLLSVLGSMGITAWPKLIDFLVERTGGETPLSLQKKELQHQLEEARAERAALTSMRQKEAAAEHAMTSGLIESSRAAGQSEALESLLTPGVPGGPTPAAMLPGQTLDTLFDIIL